MKQVTPSKLTFATVAELGNFLFRELQRIMLVVNHNAQLAQDVKANVPTKAAIGQLAYADGVNWNPGDGEGTYEYTSTGWVKLGNTATSFTLGMVFDGGGSPPTVGSVGYLVCQRAGIIDQWSVVADVAGSAVVDVWKATGVIPTVADTIAGSEKPTLTAQQLNSDTALTTWTTSVAVGDVLGFSIDSVTTCTRLTVEVRIQES